IIAGGGNVILTSGGIGAIPSTSVDGTRSFRFTKSNGTGISSAIYGVHNASTDHAMELVVESITGEQSYGTFGCKYPTGSSGSLHFVLQENITQQVGIILDDGRLTSRREITLWPDVVVTDRVFINETDNSFMTYGLTVKTGATTDEVIALKASDVIHGIEAVTQTDTFATFNKINSYGGMVITGFTEYQVPLNLQGVFTTGDTAKTSSALSAVRIQGWKKSGTNVTGPATNENVFTIRSGSNTVFIVDADGDTYIPSGAGYNNMADDYDDIKLLTAARVLGYKPLEKRFQNWIDYAKPILEELGIIHFNDNNIHFMSQRGMTHLMIDTMRQLHERILQLEAINENHN
ncbi:hypothetical protein KAR91_82035, partial [Candidatus Pacearchaeota archaeon]|nr:hypothetical protein [Candidatus Pacearchaeota archaeon]